ncbi:YpdA family putative bacillithiol disulfide reductase [Aquimarina sp. AD10]|uniref:YpdA family putative bacillithiol disulfide reductase n=1 Tax=Aquimarina sp. AD10 TaxID=1714849 RepID=UPI000E4DD7EB|nr:YpdA family putative bacillithiol disulfide reductase [Aquimarina sp. AD10]AXT62578.1 YpdA family putative bacillithiol disulfide reductase [Aquimarina sp. AD10]RKM97763.1 YpdA family putative bacillithiol disulfide reductase [Aquimarina sp. AD10]
MTHYSILIIGAGPIGLSCGIEAQNAGISYKIIDKGTLVNSIHNFPTDMTFFSSSEKLEIGNLPFTSLSVRPTKQEGLEYYRRVAQHYKLNIGLYETFESVKRTSNLSNKTPFKIATSKEAYTCDFIINATGFYDSPVLLDIPGEKLKKVNHYFTSAHHLFKQKVAVVGASNSAIDVALEAYRKGAETTLLVRGKEISPNVKYWIKPDIEARIAENNINIYYESDVTAISDRHIIFKSRNQTIKLENDFVYAMTGYRPNFNLSEKLGIEIDSTTGYPKYNKTTMETTNPNVYLAGVVIGGMNTRQWFIENSRDHGSKIINHIKKYETKK